MSLPNAIQGGLRPALVITWYETGTNKVVDLTGATLSGLIQTAVATVAIAGSLTLIDAPNGVFQWNLAAADVATAGMCEVQFVATFLTSPTPAKTFVASWQVGRSLAAT